MFSLSWEVVKQKSEIDFYHSLAQPESNFSLEYQQAFQRSQKKARMQIKEKLAARALKAKSSVARFV